MDGTAEEKKGTSVCDMKGMDLCSGIRPGQVLGGGRMLGSGHEPADGLHRFADSEGGNTCPCASCGFDRTQNWDYVGRS